MDYFLDFLLNFYGPMPYFIIFGILLACGLGLPIPEDVTLFAAGVLAYYGVVSLKIIIVTSFIGVLLGDSIIFFLGKIYGPNLTKVWFFARIFTENRLKLVQTRFLQQGNKLIFAARFMPGLRAPIFFSAGLLHLPTRIFLFYDGTAALISVPLIIWSVYYFGDELDHVIKMIKNIEHGVVGLIFFIIAVMTAKWYVAKRKLNNSTSIR